LGWNRASDPAVAPAPPLRRELALVGCGIALVGTSIVQAAELATILLPQEQEIQTALEAGPEQN
jgi:hypothetical protein